MKNILMVEKQDFVASGLVHLVQSWGYVVDLAHSAEEALKVLELRPNRYSAAITNINLPYMDGIELCKRVDVPSIVISNEVSESYVLAAKKVGVRGYIAKNRAAEELQNVLRIVLMGGVCYCVCVPLTKLQKQQKASVRLTKKEREVLALIGKGLTTKQIGKQLHIADCTVETHRRNLLGKLGAKNSKELLLYVAKNGVC